MIQNPFALLTQAGRSPLCPWRWEQHIHYYSPVDHIAAALETFQGAIENWDTKAAGKFAFVCGEAGCGKSSLIHRCTHILYKKLETRNPKKIWIVDLIDEPHPDGALPKTKYSFSLILDRMNDECSDVFLAVDRKFISEPTIDLPLSATRISSRLVQKNVILILLTPHVKSEAEIKAMLNLFYRPNIFVFTEAADTSLLSFCLRHHGSRSSRPVITLSIGEIGQPDSVTYKNDRMNLLKKIQVSGFPEFSDSVMEQFFTERASLSFGMSVRELEWVCRHAFDRAQQRGDSKIETTDLLSFYMTSFQPNLS